jgi:DNA repair exonuclease SbcCD ATPase subunit
MKEISREKRLEVAQHYLLGYTFKEIEEWTGISHGSIANILKEMENGILTIPGTPFDQVNDLRQLSFVLKKNALQPSQALLGLSFFQRLGGLGVIMEHLEKWSELIKKCAPFDYPAEKFTEAALRLHDLEEGSGKPFEELTLEYSGLIEQIEKLTAEVGSLIETKSGLSEEVKPLSSHVEALKKEQDKLESEVKIKSARRNEVGQEVKKAEKCKSRLGKETKELQTRRVKLSSEVDAKEEALKRINEIGLSDEDLLRLRVFLEKMGKGEKSDTEQCKERFFYALSVFKDISGLEKKREAQVQKLNEVTKEKSVQEGELMGLEKKKGKLQGEIQESISLTLQGISNVGEEAASQIKQQLDSIKLQFGILIEDTLVVGQAVGAMQQMVNKGEAAGNSLKDLVTELQSRMGRNQC